MAIDLGKQVGPLPLGAWIVVVGGGLGIAYYSYTRSGTTPVAINPGTGDGSVGGWVPTEPGTGGGGDSGNGEAPVTTNEAWGVRAINWLIAQGYNPAESDSAIRKYLAGNDPAPSIKEYALQAIALARWGSPPNPLPPPLSPPPTVTPPPTTPPSSGPVMGIPEKEPYPRPPYHPIPPPPSQAPPPTTPPKQPPAPKPAPQPGNTRWFVVKAWPLKGSSLWSIAEIFYGNGSQYSRIFNANKKGVRRPDGTLGMIVDPNIVHAGWRLYIP